MIITNLDKKKKQSCYEYKHYIFGASGQCVPEPGMRLVDAHPFGTVEQWSRWWNKAPNLSERQRDFDVPPLASSAGKPVGQALLGERNNVI